MAKKLTGKMKEGMNKIREHFKAGVWFTEEDLHPHGVKYQRNVLNSLVNADLLEYRINGEFPKYVTEYRYVEYSTKGKSLNAVLLKIASCWRPMISRTYDNKGLDYDKN